MKRKIDTRKTFTLTISFVLALIIVYSGFLNALMAFVLVGAIPGTSLSISPSIMLVACAAIGWLIVFGYIARRYAFQPKPEFLQNKLLRLIRLRTRQALK
jgi:hypothetical protein